MKIVSEFKDYYDHLQWERGSDPKVTYERVPRFADGEPANFVPEFLRPRPYFGTRKEADVYWERRKKPNLIVLAVCGRLYCIAEEGGTLKHGPRFWSDPKADSVGIAAFPASIRARSTVHLRQTDLNDRHRSPVILLKDGWGLEPDVLDPCLANFKFDKVLPPEAMFMALTDFFLKYRPSSVMMDASANVIMGR